MSFDSLNFIIFVLVGLIVYYVIPKKCQWIWLLILSYTYYISFGVKIVPFLLLTTCVIYIFGRILMKINEQELDRDAEQKKKRKVLILALVIVFGILAVLKYTGFFVENINSLFHTKINVPNLILPLGISFYTFQSVSYIMDLYWKKIPGEKNFFRFALFISFFPQIMQGPIGRYSRLSNSLFKEHKFDLINIEHSVQLILWGFFKKLVLADRAAIVVNEVFNNYKSYKGLAVIIAVLGYSIELYGDFSGGIDIVRGIGGLFGITMDENFRQPYFATSITDFWHRWHITLGTWMKDYVFVPFTMSKCMGKIGKKSKRIFGRSTGRIIPMCIANVVVFLIVGIWHGAAWKYIAYGLYNGLLIALANLLEPQFKKIFKRTGINRKGNPWKVFMILRTFILVNISWFFDMGISVKAAFLMMKNMVVIPNLSQLAFINQLGENFGKKDVAILIFGIIILLVIGTYNEIKGNVIEKIDSLKIINRWIIYIFIIFSLPILGYISEVGGFIYAQF